MVEVVGGHNFVFDSLVVVLHAVLGIVAFEDVQVFH